MIETPKEKKQRAIERLRQAIDENLLKRFSEIDERLSDYFASLRDKSSIGESEDLHNYYELLGGLRFIRLFNTYEFDSKKVKKVIRLREGKWRKEGKRWTHISGGLVQEGDRRLVYRWEPFQVFLLSSVFGFKKWVNTELQSYTRELLPSEKDVNGEIWDLRRLCRDFTFFSPRKTDKTGMSAFIQVVFFLLEDSDGEEYCCANSSDQAKILYDRTRGMLRQLDESGQRIRQTATICDWRPSYQNIRSTSIRPLTAGGKTKDGYRANLCCADEYGAAAWVKGRSDMKQLVDVIESSMGSRREPLTFTTTTAGTITDGPFVEKLASLHVLLERELDYESDGSSGQQTSDNTLCLLLEPDAWERDEETLLTDRTLRRKINPMLGLIVQHSFYDEWSAKARLDATNLPEFTTKLMNVYRSSSVKEWITPEQVRRLQKPMRVTDCIAEDGWIIFVGMDFSLGDDLHSLSYLCVRINPATRQKEFFADMDSWITEHALSEHPLKEVLRKWSEQGWLHIAQGETLQPELPVGRIAEVAEAIGYNIWMFLYDPYKAKIPINALCEYVFSLGADPKTKVVPCRQNYATFNPLVLELDYMIKNDPPLISFSQNPMWAWEAGNMVLDTSTDGMDNKKMRKRAPGSKIDNWVALAEALHGYDMIEGQTQESSGT